MQLNLLTDALLLLYVPALLPRQPELGRNIVPEVELLLLGQIVGALQVLDRFVERFQLHQAEAEKEVPFDEVRIHIERPPAVDAGRLPALHFDVAEGAVRKVGGICGVFDLRRKLREREKNTKIRYRFDSGFLGFCTKTIYTLQHTQIEHRTRRGET